MSKLLRVKDVQEKFGCSKQTAYDMVRLRDFPKLTIGKRYYIPEDELDKWISKNVTSTIMLRRDK